jgi:CTP:molybdopterin cytidylyltransferase MocA
VGAVVLAAGASTRLGAPKQLVMHAGEPLVRRAARAALAAGARPVLVVLGAHAGRIAPVLDGLDGASTIVHAGWRDGLASSLAAGLHALLAAARCDAILVTLADQPLVDASALRALLDRFGAARRIVAAEYDGVPGVPIVIGREHAAALMRLTGDRGAGAWLRSRGAEVTRVPLPAAAVDVDTPADVVRLGAADRGDGAEPADRADTDSDIDHRRLSS